MRRSLRAVADQQGSFADESEQFAHVAEEHVDKLQQLQHDIGSLQQQLLDKGQAGAALQAGIQDHQPSLFSGPAVLSHACAMAAVNQADRLCTQHACLQSWRSEGLLRLRLEGMHQGALESVGLRCWANLMWVGR